MTRIANRMTGILWSIGIALGLFLGGLSFLDSASAQVGQPCTTVRAASVDFQNRNTRDPYRETVLTVTVVPESAGGCLKVFYQNTSAFSFVPIDAQGVITMPSDWTSAEHPIGTDKMTEDAFGGTVLSPICTSLPCPPEKNFAFVRQSVTIRPETIYAGGKFTVTHPCVTENRISLEVLISGFPPLQSIVHNCRSNANLMVSFPAPYTGAYRLQMLELYTTGKTLPVAIIEFNVAAAPAPTLTIRSFMPVLLAN